MVRSTFDGSEEMNDHIEQVIIGKLKSILDPEVSDDEDE